VAPFKGAHNFISLGATKGPNPVLHITASLYTLCYANKKKTLIAVHIHVYVRSAVRVCILQCTNLSFCSKLCIARPVLVVQVAG
jgi:hypothetical protein